MIGRVRWARVPDHELIVGSAHAMVFAVDNARPASHEDSACRVATPLGLILLAPRPRWARQPCRRRGADPRRGARARRTVAPAGSASTCPSCPRRAGSRGSSCCATWTSVDRLGGDRRRATSSQSGGLPDRVDGIVPPLVVRPGTVDEVQAVVRAGVPLVATGLGAHLDIGGVPRALDVMLRLDRIDRVLDHQAADMTVTVEAGCSLARLQATARRGRPVAAPRSAVARPHHRRRAARGEPVGAAACVAGHGARSAARRGPSSPPTARWCEAADAW